MKHARVVGFEGRNAWSADNTEGHASRRRIRRSTVAYVVFVLLVLADTADRVYAQAQAGGGDDHGNGNANANANGKSKGERLVTTSQETTVQSGILGTTLIGMGLLLCAAGCRWLRVTCSVVGWLLWGGSCWVAMANSETSVGYGSARSTAYLLLPMIVGIMGGLLFTIIQLAALLFSGALAGIAFALTISSVREGGLFNQYGVQIAVLTVLGLLGLVLMLLYDRNVRNWPLTICISVLGAYTTVLGLDQFVHTGLSNVIAAIFDRNVDHDQSKMTQYGLKDGLYVLLVLDAVLAIGGILFQTYVIPKMHPPTNPVVAEEPAGEMIQTVIVPRNVDVDVDTDDGHVPDDVVVLDVDLSPPHRHSTHSSWSSLSRPPRLPRVDEEELPRRMPSFPPGAVIVDSDYDADSDITPPQPPYSDDRVFQASLESLSFNESRRNSDKSNASNASSIGLESTQRAAATSPLLRAVTMSATRAANASGSLSANMRTDSRTENNTNFDYNSSTRRPKRSSLSSSSSARSLPSSFASSSLASSSLALAHDGPTSSTWDTADAQPHQDGKGPNITKRRD